MGNLGLEKLENWKNRPIKCGKWKMGKLSPEKLEKQENRRVRHRRIGKMGVRPRKVENWEKVELCLQKLETLESLHTRKNINV